MRKRVPGLTCFSTSSVGVLKKTMEPLSALSTNATASARMPRAAPIREKRRCLRVIIQSVGLAFQTKPSEQIVEPPQLGRIAGERAPRIGDGRARLVGLAQHHIGANEPQPFFDIAAVAMQPLRQRSEEHTSELQSLRHLVCRLL